MPRSFDLDWVQDSASLPRGWYCSCDAQRAAFRHRNPSHLAL
ncbi:hypothetical protein AM1_0446 [Acaryochloris marina MBIC11017]|uniref:Uncharacterized protein n=1 Tax=Acaryochloris marina (strain MBIC 11017) TaxID=329726 RepID=B0CB12_ACAM1|nr:hypothetical protein AM1_0446 [Acaryochloris marina MBIC11017]